MSSDSRFESPPAVLSEDQHTYSHCNAETEDDSDCSEVLSVGSEPSPAVAGSISRSKLKASRSPSPVSSDGSGSRVVQHTISASSSPSPVTETYSPCQIYPLQEDCNSSLCLHSTRKLHTSDVVVGSNSCGLYAVDPGSITRSPVNSHYCSAGSSQSIMVAFPNQRTSPSHFRSIPTASSRLPFHYVIDQLQDVVKHVDSASHQRSRQQRVNPQVSRHSPDKLLGWTQNHSSAEPPQERCLNNETVESVFVSDNRQLNANDLKTKISATDSVCDDRNNDSVNDHDSSMQYQHSLKFSIDNILKADFGRRITDPMVLKKPRLKKHATRPINLSKDLLDCSSENLKDKSDSVSEVPLRLSTNVLDPEVSSTPATEPKLMQWPAWVYCTRYSDRPSSGNV
ncbi:hypothetical protein QAD02_021782 [Eretmocerus hayati]|uniref:Uncharacterized protein n=1 Tax=Eretmocerus hayati TaxID=131215 RepID=A0ACC2PQW4_9HYME|nr:hypothetical protein QAD02_021782 [Eretmocerus hayati]